MMKATIILMSTLFLFGISNGQEKKDKPQAPKSILDVLEAKKQKLFAEAFANQDTVAALAKQKPKTVIVEKVRYVKIYKTVPIYVPDTDTVSYREAFPADTIESDYFISPPRIVPAPIKKKSFLYGLFH